MTESLVVIRRFSNIAEAEVAQSALEAADITSMLRADDAGGLQPALWMGEGIALVVYAEDALRADQVLSTDFTRPEDDRD